MRMNRRDWIRLDYLEFFCEKHHLIIECVTDEQEVWISPLGPHPSTLTSDQVHDILRESSLFEIRKLRQGDPDFARRRSMTRSELEQHIQKMMH